MGSLSSELYFFLSLPAFCVGLSRGGLGAGFGLAAAVIASQILEPIKAAAFLLPLLILSDPLSVWIYRKHIYWQSIKILLPGILLGIFVTFFLVNLITNQFISLIVGLLAVFLVFDQLISKLKIKPKNKVSPSIGIFLGAMGGFSSFIIHSGLPPIAAYLLPLKLTRKSFMGTVAFIFAITNIIKLLPYFLLGLLEKELVQLTLIYIPITYLGIYIGKLINNIISDQIFFFIIYTTILILGMRLIWLSI